MSWKLEMFLAGMAVYTFFRWYIVPKIDKYVNGNDPKL